jgi:hypothetical protein
MIEKKITTLWTTSSFSFSLFPELGVVCKYFTEQSIFGGVCKCLFHLYEYCINLLSPFCAQTTTFINTARSSAYDYLTLNAYCNETHCFLKIHLMQQ